jgi:hypothetical protein
MTMLTPSLLLDPAVLLLASPMSSSRHRWAAAALIDPGLAAEQTITATATRNTDGFGRALSASR